MSRFARVLCVLVVLSLAIPAATVAAGTSVLPANCTLTVRPDTESYVICMPPVLWNHDLIVFAHGYEFDYPAAAPKLGEEQWAIKLSGGGTITLPELVNLLGYGFATTSYSKNGLAVQEGVGEMKDLVEYVRTNNPGVRNVYIVGASEGGLITALSMERNADVYQGGLALCGPVGDFQKQINYWGDFRAAYDAIFPGLPADAVAIPEPLMADWILGYPASTSQSSVVANLSAPANALKVMSLLTLTGAPYDPADIYTIGTTTLGILSYNVLATNEARIELGNIQPYDNTANVALLGAGATHYIALGDVATALAPYNTTGLLTKPLVTMHNVGDPIVPIWHETLYAAKTILTGSSAKLTAIPISTYGHCVFKPAQVLFGFALMLYKAHNLPVSLLPFQAALAGETGGLTEFNALNAVYGDISKVQTYLPVINNQP